VTTPEAPTRRPETAGPVTTAQEHTYLSHRQILVVLCGVMAGMFLAALDQTIVGTALPTIVSDLGGLNHLSWVVTAYLLTSTASTPLWGKISDLYGRRPIFQTAIVIFLVGSVVAALSQNMGTLIAGRALQGLGAGGLIALALSIIGDIIPPRERGRYQGYFGAVFGIASVAGPLLGGWFTDGPGWQWIFWLNVPIGVAALVVTTVALRMPTVRREHSIDYVGASLVVAAVSSLLLYLSWAGPSASYGWGAPLSLSLLGASFVFTALFVLVESRVAEPILPLRLFSSRVFSWTALFATIMGLAMFGAIIFMPIYLQVVRGFSPTQSGLALLPMVLGLFATSISAGQVMSRTGRYKIFPILSSVATAGALLLLSTLSTDTPYWTVGLFVFVLGAALGLSMQIVITAVQNDVDRRDLGAATSGVTFFRSLGGAIGVALFGAVLNSRLTHYLSAAGGAAPSGGSESNLANSVTAIRALPAEAKIVVVDAWTKALHDVFLTAVPFLVLALVAALLAPEKRLGTRADADEPQLTLAE